MSDDRDWRKSAYLSKENWPEAIPEMGPKREYGPHPWGPITEADPEWDDYPYTHPAAASVGDIYMGDVCPRCGVPLKYTERVVSISGDRGPLHEVSLDENPVPAYHPDCWREREAERYGHVNTTLSEFEK